MLVDWLARKWAVNNAPPQFADLVFVVAHGSVGRHASVGLAAVVRRTQELMRVYCKNTTRTILAFGEFTFSEYHGEERSFKLQSLPSGYFLGQVASTTEEAMKAAELMTMVPCDPRKIVIVTDEAHSRRCRLIWRRFFPLAEVFIVSVPLRSTIERESPMTAYRTAWRILLLNVLLTPMFASMKREQMVKLAGFHQPTL